MSLSLVNTWVTGTLNSREVALDVLNLFHQAAAQDVDATVIAAPELTINNKSYLAHWTGEELVVLELSRSQQQGFGLVPRELVKALAPRDTRPDLQAVRRVTLSSIRIDDGGFCDGRSPVTGTAAFEISDPMSYAIFSCALRAQYFRPDMKWQVTGHWHSSAPLVPPRGELHFSITPFFGKDDPDYLRGPMVMFFQLVTAQNLTEMTGCRRISNVVASIIEIR